MARTFALVTAAVLSLAASAQQGAENLTKAQLVVSPAALPTEPLGLRLRCRVAAQTEGDAAGLYTQATLMLEAIPRESMLELNDLLEASDTSPPNAAARNLVESFRGAVWPSLRIASTRSGCQWPSTVREEGAAALLPALGKFRVIARLLSLQTRVQIADGKLEEAMDTIRVTLDLGRRLGEGPTLIHALVGVAVCSVALERTQDFIQAPGAPNLFWALSELPQPLIDLADPIRGELALVEYSVPDLGRFERGELGDGDAPSIIRQLKIMSNRFGLPGPTEDRGGLATALATAAAFPHARDVLLAAGRTPEEIDAMPASAAVLRAQLVEWRRASDMQLVWASRPMHEALTGLIDLDAKVSAGAKTSGTNPLLMSMPSTVHAFRAGVTLQRRVELLRTLEAIRLHAATHGSLPASLDQLQDVPVPRDPLTLGAFSYKAEGGSAVVRTVSPTIPETLRRDIELRITLRK
jgi:hypothetical protein